MFHRLSGGKEKDATRAVSRVAYRRGRASLLVNPQIRLLYPQNDPMAGAMTEELPLIVMANY